MQAGVTLVPKNHLGELLHLAHIYLDLLTSLFPHRNLFKSFFAHVITETIQKHTF